jgi:hypothetical protein
MTQANKPHAANPAIALHNRSLSGAGSLTRHFSQRGTVWTFRLIHERFTALPPSKPLAGPRG